MESKQTTALKCVFVGDVAVGKTYLLSALSGSKFSQDTVTPSGSEINYSKRIHPILIFLICLNQPLSFNMEEGT
jgi:GTPase SAR1 family protein